MEFEVGRRQAIMCDLDGTLCINDQGRSPFDYLSARHDAVNPAVAKTLLAFIEGSEYHLVFISARESFGGDVFLDWLRHHLPELMCRGWSLYMRHDKDHRKDSIVKREIYENMVVQRYDVQLVLDDRDQVVNMWRDELNLTCFQVAKGDF